MDRKRPFAELSLAVASAVAAGALFWWLLAQRSESPILGRVGAADGEVTDAGAATDRIALAGTPATEPVARLAPGAALHWSVDGTRCGSIAVARGPGFGSLRNRARARGWCADRPVLDRW